MTLTGDQEAHAREVAENEVRRFARLLAEEIGRTPVRQELAPVNARDLWTCVNDALRRYEAGDVG